MDYDFSKLNKSFSQLNKINSTDIIKNLSPASKIVEQSFAVHGKFIQNSSGMQVALKTLSDTLQASSYKDLVASSGTSVLSSVTKNLSSLNIDSLSETVLDSAAILNTENDSQDFIELDKSLTDIIKEIDESIQLPIPDNQGNTRIEKTNWDLFLQVISIVLAIISILQTAYYHNIETVSSTQDQANHAELLQEEKKQTREEEKQTAELIKQTEILEQIENNTATDATLKESFQLPHD